MRRRIPQESRLPWDHIWVLVRAERRLDTADLRWSGARCVGLQAVHIWRGGPCPVQEGPQASRPV